MRPRSRREFVALASAATAAAVVWPRRMLADVDPTLPIRDAVGFRRDVDVDADAVAARALEAARAGGASYADVRVDRQIHQALAVTGELGNPVSYGESVGYGVRVIADGQWGFVYSPDVTPDAVAEAAGRAVHQARTNAVGRKTALVLAAAPIVPAGRWVSPVVVDPFAVSVGEQEQALLAGTRAALAVDGMSRGGSAGTGVAFFRVDRTFASSEGSHIEQTFTLGFPNAHVMSVVADDPTAIVGRSARGVTAAAMGYEIVRDARLPDAMHAAAADAMRVTRGRSVDVGRYELVMDGQAMAGLIATTIGEALGLDRVLGKRAGESGTSFVAPPDRVLGAMQLASSLLTVRADRSLPGGLMTVGWDDDGVAPDEFPLIDHGIVVDYMTTRETAPELGWWYQGRRAPTRSRGCAAAKVGGLPQQEMSNLSVDPAVTAVTVDDLVKDVKHGIYLSGSGWFGTDFQLRNTYGGAECAQEIRNGKVAGYVRDLAIQLQAETFWKGLVAVGGAGTVARVGLGYPGLFKSHTVRAPAARFREVNVVNIGRTQ